MRNLDKNRRNNQTLGALCIFSLLGLIAVTASTPVRAQNDPPHPELLHGMVLAAQQVYERAEQLQSEGRESLANELFDQSLEILMNADELGGGSYKARFDRIYTKYFDTRVERDPRIAEQRNRLSGEIEQAYQAAPVQPGQVAYMVEYLAKHRKQFLENSFRRSLRYLPMIREIFAAQGVPPDLAMMALIESGFRPDPTSHAGAQGLWQFMPATGRQYGLRVDNRVDERNDPEKATVAASKYLLYLRNKFDDWPLAVAAYNCGEGCVERALRKHRVETFWDLAEAGGLPRETERYVPSIVAATIISREPRAYGIDYP